MSPVPLYLLERYDRSGRPSPPRPPDFADGQTRLLAAIYVAADQATLLLVEGSDAHSVRAAAEAAAWPVDRVVAVVALTERSPGEAPTQPFTP